MVLTALAVPLAVMTYDIASRGEIVAYLEPRLLRTYAIGAALSFLLWGLGMEAARHPNRIVRAAALTILGATAAFGIGGQANFRGITNEYVTREAILLGAAVPGIVTDYARAHALRMALFFAIPALAVVGLGVARVRAFGARRRYPTVIAVVALGVLLQTMSLGAQPDWYQCLPPDVLWVQGTGAPILLALGAAPVPRTLPAGQHAPLPTSTVPLAADTPSLIVLLGESVRRDAVCVARQEGCSLSPAVDAAAPDRIGFSRAYAVASCTELAASVLWSGLPITADPQALARAPLLWDYAKARGYRTGYITSQDLVYQHLDLFLRGSRIDWLREARDRQANPPLNQGTPDEVTLAEAADFIEAGGPTFAVVHLANTHAPYRQVPGYLPYSASSREDAARVAYRNSLFHDDAIVGEFLARLRRGARGRRAIVVSLSDHGEAFGEHRAVTHTFDLYAEEIAIPLWIDAPAGSLPDPEIDRLRADAPTRPTSTADVGATIVDLLGALDDPALREHTARFAGVSLLRDAAAARDVLLWNCPLTRGCPADAFGVIAWPLKLHYVGREMRYACHDLEADPEERRPLPLERCAALRARVDGIFGPRFHVSQE